MANLWDSTQQKWNEEQMLQNFSQQAVIKIINSVHKANPNATHPDTLVWRLTPNDRYNVKRDTFSLLEKKIALLTLAYGESFAGIIPRVKTFLWRACKDALPVMDVLHRIINRVGQTCLVCGMENASPLTSRKHGRVSRVKVFPLLEGDLCVTRKKFDWPASEILGCKRVNLIPVPVGGPSFIEAIDLRYFHCQHLPGGFSIRLFSGESPRTYSLMPLARR